MEVKILKKLSEKSGNSLPLACAVVLSLLLVSSAVMEYIRLSVIAGGVRDALQASIISVATGNYDKTYDGLREGYSGGYSRTSDTWKETLNYGNIYDEMGKLLGLNSSHTKKTGSNTEYSLSGLTVNIVNAPFAPANPNTANKFTANAQIILQIPLSFGWSSLPPVKMTIRTTAGYMQKF